MITLGELQIGVELATNPQLEQKKIAYFELNVDVLPVTNLTASLYARIYAQLRRAGKQIPTNDIWIAACALEHNLPLDTTDAHFALVPGLRLV